MDLSEFKISAGNRHPWETARAASLKEIIASLCPPAKDVEVLDIGCGDGYTIASLLAERDDLRISAVDLNLSNEQIAYFSKKYPQISFFTSLTDLNRNAFELITLFDVIEHTPDDLHFLAEITPYACSGAHIFITAPAFNQLFGKHDRFLKHYRRYNKKELEELLTKAGLEVIASEYLFHSLLIFRFLVVLLEKIGLLQGQLSEKGVSGWRHGEFISAIISRLLISENRFFSWINKKGFSFPGLTVWAICRKQL